MGTFLIHNALRTRCGSVTRVNADRNSSARTIADIAARQADAILNQVSSFTQTISKPQSPTDGVGGGNDKQCGVGVTLREESGQLVVSKVAAGSPAHFSGRIAVGDVLVAVNSLQVLRCAQCKGRSAHPY